MSFLRYLDIEQLLILKDDVEREISERKQTSLADNLVTKRAERFGNRMKYFYSQDPDFLSQSLSSSRKKSAQYFDDTRIIKRNREQREEFIRELDEELDAYAAERDAILAKREAKRGKKYDWSTVLEASE